jgi:hypothetical protein
VPCKDESPLSGSRGIIVLLEKHVHLQNDAGAGASKVVSHDPSLEYERGGL